MRPIEAERPPGGVSAGDTAGDTICVILAAHYTLASRGKNRLEHFVSLGGWIRRRRRLLDMTQAELAAKVSCSLSMLRKIERDERRPSEQLAGILADHLAIEAFQRPFFLQLARGYYTTGLDDPTKAPVTPVLPHPETGELRAEKVPFVAREGEVRDLQDHLDKAVAGQGRMVFVSGEAGRGKTSLLYEFAHRAMAAKPDLVVAGGRSDVYTGIGDPLLPFRDIFRMLGGDVESAGMSGIVTHEVAERIARALRETAEVLLVHGPDLIGTLVSGSVLEASLARGLSQGQSSMELLVRLQEHRARMRAARHELQQDRLFDEVSTTLNHLSRRYPLLLMLDDLHWADMSSAGLLGHLTMRLQQARILIVGSFRPEDLAHAGSQGHGGRKTANPLQEVLAESQRQFGRNLVDLDRPEHDEELDFINALLDQEPNQFAHEFRQQLARITAGNALFAIELLQDMKDRGDIMVDDQGRWVENNPLNWEYVPARVEGVIEKRIGRLPAELRDLLTIGCVQGETFFAEVIAQITRIDARALTRRLSAALDRRHRLIREQGVKRIGDERMSEYRFRHHLFQKYLYGRLAAAERMYLHEDVGLALEALYADSPDASDLPAAQLARHFQEAGLGGKASKYRLLAGQSAAHLLAFDEAVAQFEGGLLLLENVHRNREINRLEFELTLALGRAYWHGGRVAESMPTLERSIELARTLDVPDALARAALAYEEPRSHLILDVERSQRHMRDALATLGEEESPLRVRLLVNLSRDLLVAGAQEELRTTLAKALTLARQIDDPVALCDALRISAEIDRRPETTAARLEAIEEMIAVARSTGDGEKLSDALDLYVYDQLELGHIDIVDEAIGMQKSVAAEMKHAFQLHIAAVFETMRAIMRGEFEKAERLALTAFDISRQLGIADLDGIVGIHMFSIRWQQGRLNEVAPIVKLYAASNTSPAAWRPGLALICAALDLQEECRAVFDELVTDTLAFAPQDSLRVASLAYLTEACAYLGDAARAQILYELLLPYDGRAVVVGGATACYGAAARYLGMLATIQQRWDAAERHFQGAIELDARMGARPWLAHSQYEYASMLLARGKAEDRLQALQLLAEAQAAAEEMGMAYLRERVSVRQEESYDADFHD